MISVRVLAAFGLTAALLSAGSPASAAKPVAEVERHCIIEVLDTVDGVFKTAPEVCFDSMEALQAVAFSPEASVLGSNVVGTHFTLKDFSGSTATIMGTTCDGGTWLPTGGWNNNIESSYNYCGPMDGTTFRDNSACTLGVLTIYNDAPSLGTMNNKTSCIKYN